MFIFLYGKINNGSFPTVVAKFGGVYRNFHANLINKREREAGDLCNKNELKQMKNSKVLQGNPDIYQTYGSAGPQIAQFPNHKWLRERPT